jgi:hypothetical protein
MQEKKKLPFDQRILFFLILVELCMGFLFYPVTLLQQVNSPLCPVLQYLFFILHLTCMVVAVVISLSRAVQSKPSDGLKLLALFWLGLMMKDHIGATISYLVLYGGTYTVVDIFILSAMETAANTLFAQGIAFLIQYFGLWLLFLKKKEKCEIPIAPLANGRDPLSRATLTLVVLYAVVDILTQILDIVEFGESNFWLISTEEYISMAIGLVVTLVAALLAYMGAGYARTLLARRLDNEN